MKRIIPGVLVTSALVLGGTALAKGKSTTSSTTSTTTTTAKAAGTAEYRGFMVPTDPKAFLERIHHVNQDEIAQARLAEKNSTNEDVKSFAAQMIKDHTDADQKIQDLAKAQKLTLAEPKPANDVEKRAMAADKATLDKLQVLKGEAFDGCYMANQLGAHDATLGKLMAGKQALSGNAQLSSLVDDLIQSVSMHRQHAYTLLGKLSPAGSGTTTSVGGSGGTMAPGSQTAPTTGAGSTGAGSMGAGSTGGSTQPKP